MRTQEQLSLPDGFESPHPPLPHPDHLMGLLYPTVGIPTRDMDDLRHHLATGLQMHIHHLAILVYSSP